MRSSNGFFTSISRRWDEGLDNNDANISQDLIAYRDVVAVLINGPGVNDINNFIRSTVSDSEMRAFANQIGGSIGRIAGDCETFNMYAKVKPPTDMVLCEMIPKNTEAAAGSLPNERQTQVYLNDSLGSLSFNMQVPIALVYDDYTDNGDYADSIHADSDGITWIAEQIADAYENNSIAVGGTNRKTQGIGSTNIQGEI